MQTFCLAGIVALATILISTETMAASKETYIVAKPMLDEILASVKLQDFKDKFPLEVVLIAQATVFILEGHPDAPEPTTSESTSVKTAQPLHKYGTFSYWGKNNLTLDNAKVLLVGGMSGNSAGPYGASLVLAALGVKTEIFSTESTTESGGNADAKTICNTLISLFKGIVAAGKPEKSYFGNITSTKEVDSAQKLISEGDNLVGKYNNERKKIPQNRLYMAGLLVEILTICGTLDGALIKRIQDGEFHLVGDVSCGEGKSEALVTFAMIRKLLIIKAAEAVKINGGVRNLVYANDSPSIHNRSLGYGSVMIPYVPFVGEVGILPAANFHAYMPKDSVVNGDFANSILHYFMTPHQVREVLDKIEIPAQPNDSSAKLKFEPGTKTWQIQKHSGDNFKNHLDGTRARINFEYAELVSPDHVIYVDDRWTVIKDDAGTRTFFGEVAKLIRKKKASE